MICIKNSTNVTQENLLFGQKLGNNQQGAEKLLAALYWGSYFLYSIENKATALIKGLLQAKTAQKYVILNIFVNQNYIFQTVSAEKKEKVDGTLTQRPPCQSPQKIIETEIRSFPTFCPFCPSSVWHSAFSKAFGCHPDATWLLFIRRVMTTPIDGLMVRRSRLP